MPDQQNSENPSAKTPEKPTAPSPVTEPTPSKAEMAGNGNKESKYLEKPPKNSPWNSVEIVKIIGEITLILIGVKALCVYSGQLSQMIESNHISHEALESVQRAFVTYQAINTYRVP